MTIERPIFPPAAESVHSFSLQPAIAQPESGNLTSESGKAASGLSRRTMLGALAALPAALPAAAEPLSDPVFALIEAHRAAHIAHGDALVVQDRLEKTGNIEEAWRVSENPCCVENDAFDALVAAPATTRPGLLAQLAYFQKLAADDETDWMFDDRIQARVLIDSFAASLKNIGVLS